MYKLLNILNEIKIISKVTPEMVRYEWYKICSYTNDNIVNEINEFEDKLKNEIYGTRLYSWIGNTGLHNLKLLNKQQLNYLYTEMINFINTHEL